MATLDAIHRGRPRTAAPSPARRAAPAEGGFTLVEMIVGLSILLIGALGLVASIVTTVQAGRVAREHTTALAAAEDRMQAALVASEVELLAMDGETFAVGGLPERLDGTPLGEVAVDTAGAPLYRVEVRIRWLGPYGDDDLVLDTTIVPQ